MLISPAYRTLNERLHADDPAFGNSGHFFGKIVRDILAGDPGIKTALDYGCGKGTLKTAAPRAEWREYDPAVQGKDAAPLPADLVCCTEVLEHVEPECLDAVLEHLKELTRRICFMTVATRPALKFLPDGRNAHLIQKPEQWWENCIKARFTILRFTKQQAEVGSMYLGIPRKESP